MKLSRYIIFSIVLSVFLHLLLLQLTADIRVGPAVSFEEQSKRAIDTLLTFVVLTDKKEETKEIESAEKKDESLLNEEDVKKAIKPKDIPVAAKNLKLESIFEKEKLILEPEIRFTLQTKETRPLLSEATAIEADKKLLATAPRPKIVEIDYSNLELPRQALPSRLITPKLEREDSSSLMLPSLTPHGPASGSAGKSYGLSMKEAFRPSFGTPDIDFPDKAPGKIEIGKNELQLTLPPKTQKIFENPLDLSKIQESSFDAFVDIKVSVTRNKAGRGGYFQVEIIPNANSDALKDITKDTLFLIDHSTSISPQKLNQFKAATRESLAYLNPADRFNVVAFTSTTHAFADEYQNVNKESLKKADKFVASLWRGGMTDVFGGVAPYVRKSNGDRNRPLNIFLLTDGKSTVNIYEAPTFLRQINALNPGNVSIFPFSAGRQANRQLLDFLGYLNRGGRCHVDELAELQNELVTFISTHSSLIIMDLNYTAEGEVSSEIFPRSLPHLYRNEALKLYGRFNSLNDELILTLNGKDADLNVRDLVFRKKYADCPPAGEELPGIWAGQKILYLISQRNYTDNQELVRQYNAAINALIREYGVYNPY